VSSIAGENSSVVMDEKQTMVMEVMTKPLRKQNFVGSPFKFWELNMNFMFSVDSESTCPEVGSSLGE
jgi:hypothetical protein